MRADTDSPRLAAFAKRLLQACHMRKQDVRRHGRDAPQLRLLSSVSPHAPPSLLLQGVQSAYSDRAVEGILPVAMYAVLLAQLGLYLVLANVQIDFSLVIGWMGLQYLVTSSLPMLWGYFIMTLVSLPVDLVRRGTARSCRPAPCCARRAALPAPSALNALGPGRWRSARRSGEGRWTCSNSSRALHDRTPAAPCRIAASCAAWRYRYLDGVAGGGGAALWDEGAREAAQARALRYFVGSSRGAKPGGAGLVVALIGSPGHQMPCISCLPISST